jgi:hypothetical protein
MEGSGQSHAPVALPTSKKPPVLIEQEDGWASVPVWTLWRKEKFLALTRKQNPDVTVPT